MSSSRSTYLHEHPSVDTEGRAEGDVEAAVTVQIRGVAAVKLNILLVRDEHGDLGAILGGIEHLLHLIVARVETLGLGLLELGKCARLKVVDIGNA